MRETRLYSSEGGGTGNLTGPSYPYLEALAPRTDFSGARIQQAMARRRMTKTDLAQAMRTSRTVVHRLLDPKDTGVTLATLWKASRALGVRLVEVG